MKLLTKARADAVKQKKKKARKMKNSAVDQTRAGLIEFQMGPIAEENEDIEDSVDGERN